MSKRITFKERLKANILAAQLADALENNEYQGQESQIAQSPAQADLDARPDTLPHKQADQRANSPSDPPAAPLIPSQTNTQINSHSLYQSYNHTNKQTTVSSPLPPTTTDPALCMTDTQAKVLAFLVRTRVEVIKYEELSQALDIPYGTVRWAVAKLEKERFLAKRKFRKGRIQGISVTLNEAVCQDFMQKRMQVDSSIHTATPMQHSFYHTHSHTNELTLKHTLPSAHEIPLLKKERKEDSFSLKLLALTDEDLAFHYPHLHQTGFGADQIRQILERLAKVNKSAERLFDSLEYAEWELGQGPIMDKDSKAVENPCAFVFTALAKTGYYRRPKGFVSEEELAAQEAEERLETSRRARERKEAAEFETWKAGLSPEEKDSILANRIGPMDQWLKNFYFKQFKPARNEESTTPL